MKDTRRLVKQEANCNGEIRAELWHEPGQPRGVFALRLGRRRRSKSGRTVYKNAFTVADLRDLRAAIEMLYWCSKTDGSVLDPFGRAVWGPAKRTRRSRHLATR